MRFAYSTYWITFILILWVLPSVSKAQPIIVKGNLIPETSQAGTWFLDTLGHHLFRYHVDAWQQVNEMINYTDVIACNELVILQGNYRNKPYGMIEDPSSNYYTPSSRFYCGDSILLTEFLEKHVILYTGKRTQEDQPIMLTMSVHSACDTIRMDTLNGAIAFCMPKYVPGLYGRCEDYLNWGMIGTNGQWLIQPIYDQPFHFKNGIAEVIYYGQKRKINEKGEFVE